MEIADIKKLHSKDVDFCASTRDGEIGDAEEKLRLLEAALQQNVDKYELDAATEASSTRRVTQEETKEKQATKDLGEKKTRHEGNVKHQG